MTKLAAIAALALSLGACSQPAPDPVDTPTASAATTAAIAPSGPRMLIPADLDPAMLGAKIVGPQGPEVTATFTTGGRTIGDLVSYVACPQDVAECDPETMPDGTVYTYVHVVTPKLTKAAAESGGRGALLFRTARPVTGFANGIGYDRTQANAALGPEAEIEVSNDNGKLVWRVTGGDGWTTGEPITFWWQSMMPPEGPQELYQLETDGDIASGTGPFPPAQAPGPAATATGRP